MRRLIPLSLLLLTAVSLWAAPQRITIDQLRQSLAARVAAHDSDDALARYLGGIELTEQLTRQSLDEIVSADKPGPRTIEALHLIAAASTFLDPPAAEAPPQAPPDASTQQAILNAAVKYVAGTFKALPNFLASRLTDSFDDTPLAITHSGWAPSNVELHLAGTFKQEVAYRDGREVSLHNVSTSTGDTKQGASPPGLTSSGEFGPILVTVLRDVAKGQIQWSHWDKTDSGNAAVFHFQVPEAGSHYEVDFCCVRGSEDANAYGGGIPGTGTGNNGAIDPDNSYRGKPAYQGTLTIEPNTGTILRITVDPELKADGPIMRSAVAVDYGTVDIGGKTYTCPVRSVAISKSKTRLGGDMGDRTILRINEVSFTNYHRFGSSTRILDASAP
jgi:hypothetical protein